MDIALPELSLDIDRNAKSNPFGVDSPSEKCCFKLSDSLVIAAEVEKRPCILKRKFY
jgi:hypothetical protein